jgi:hypothetical protein
MATCARSREAANLLGSDLPEFARTAAAAGWSADRIRCSALLAERRGWSSCASSPDCTARSDVGSTGLKTACVKAAPTGSAVGGGMGWRQGQWQVIATASTPQQLQPQKRMGLLRCISRAAACSTPAVIRVRQGCGGSGGPTAAEDASCSPLAVAATGWSVLDGAAAALVARIQDRILYDSEIDQLDQDLAYLRQRVSHLRETSWGGYNGASEAAATTIAAAPEAAACEQQPGAMATAAATAAESLIHCEVLLEAVEAQLKVLADRSDSAGEGCRRQLEGVGEALCRRSKAESVRGVAAPPGRLVDSEDLFDDVRKRRSGLRWLPVCFVGA